MPALTRFLVVFGNTLVFFFLFARNAAFPLYHYYFLVYFTTLPYLLPIQIRYYTGARQRY